MVGKTSHSVRTQSLRQPSQLVVLPSSHCSPHWKRVIPSPHTWPGSSVQVAVRDARSLEARVVDRIARYESRPRKLFVSGRDGVEYVTALKSRVAGVTAPLAARHDRAALVTLTLAADGTLKALDFDRSSGDAAFDRGLIESVRRATFPPLPEAIRREADLLVVTLQLPER